VAPQADDPAADPVAWYARLGAHAARLLSAGWSGRHVQAVHGPEDLTLSRVAEIISEVTGHRVRAETVSQDALRRSLRAAGLGDKQVGGIAGMSAVLRDDFVAEDKRSVLSTTPTALSAWVCAHLRPALAASRPERFQDSDYGAWRDCFDTARLRR
jgi:uncharacterized protein YbjT (DUF2867 family)